MRTVKIVSGAEYRIDEQFQNLLIFGIFTDSEYLLILEFGKFQKHSI